MTLSQFGRLAPSSGQMTRRSARVDKGRQGAMPPRRPLLLEDERRLYGAYQPGNQETRNRTRWDATGRKPNEHKAFPDNE